MKGIKCIDCGQQVTTIYIHRKRCGSVKDKSGCAYTAFLINVRKRNAGYRKTKAFRKKESTYYKHWYKNNNRKRNPMAARAHSAVFAAIQLGILIRPQTCQHCNRGAKIQGHHTDYSKPLQVIWLCQPCHKIEHQISA